jgi:hypothetical protein
MREMEMEDDVSNKIPPPRPIEEMVDWVVIAECVAMLAIPVVVFIVFKFFV